MTEHFTGRTWDDELVTVSQIYLRNGSYYADYTDVAGQTNHVAMGPERKTTMSQKLCEAINAMPYQDGHEKAFPFEAILKLWKGQTYIIDQLMIGDELVKCMEALEFFKKTDGAPTYLWHKGAWHKVAGCVKRHKDNLLIEFKLYDPRIEKMEHYPIMYSTYANNWVVVRTGAEMESEKVA